MLYPNAKVVVDAIPIESPTDNKLIRAVFFNDKHYLRIFSDDGNLNDTDISGRTALHWAYRNQLNHTVTKLIELGASPTQVDKLGLLPENVSMNVTVRPIGGTVKDWIKGGANSIWTKTLKSVCCRM